MYTTNISKILLFLKNNLQKEKRPSIKAKGLEIVWLPRQDDFRNFCMGDETEEVYHKLEEVMSICLKKSCRKNEGRLFNLKYNI